VAHSPWFPKICALALLGAVGTQFWRVGGLLAFPEAARQTQNACAACHANPAGGPALTEAGKLSKQGKPFTAAAARKASYVGDNRCRTCHIQQHKAWSETAHARSMATLAGGDSAKIAAMAAKLEIEVRGRADRTDGCVTCHVTGFRLPGGYPRADSARNAAVAAVGCESCHGPGSLHISAPVADKKRTIDPGGEAACRQCHTAVLSPDFDFAAYAERGTHALKKSGN
jgi:hypothetical protein